MVRLAARASACGFFGACEKKTHRLKPVPQKLRIAEDRFERSDFKQI
jgi:hypothetical protein